MAASLWGLLVAIDLALNLSVNAQELGQGESHSTQITNYTVVQQLWVGSTDQDPPQIPALPAPALPSAE